MTIPKKQSELFAWVAVTPCDKRMDIRLPEELLDAVQAKADANGWTLSFTVKVLLASQISRKG